ncbi:Prefoldin subunit [Plasmodiophora brassicae]
MDDQVTAAPSPYAIGAYRRLRAIDTQIQQYAALDDALQALMGKPAHDIVVPISQVAFIPGQLRDTNCILALLGDSMFVEKTNRGARDLIQRRRAKLIAQRQLIAPLTSVAAPTGAGVVSVAEDGIVDIREEYVSDTEDEKTQQEPAAQRPARPAAVPDEQFEAFWNRLGFDELERRDAAQASGTKPQLDGFFAQPRRQEPQPEQAPPPPPAPVRRVSKFKADRMKRQ